MNAKELNDFADRMIELGRANGYILGMKRAIEIMRKHDLGVLHPARLEIYQEMMDCDRDSVTAYSQGAVSAIPPRQSAA